jgi:hypothetical protein
VTLAAPTRLHAEGRFYVAALDMDVDRPVLRARDARGRALRHDFSREVERCRKANADQFGGF